MSCCDFQRVPEGQRARSLRKAKGVEILDTYKVLPCSMVVVRALRLTKATD